MPTMTIAAIETPRSATGLIASEISKIRPRSATSEIRDGVDRSRIVRVADSSETCPSDSRTQRDPDVGHGNDRGNGGYCTDSHCRCLPADAKIATPRGDIAITALHIGDLVWTADQQGRRIAVPIRNLSSVPFSGAHPVHEVTLDDGRVFRASAGHPLVDRSLVGGLRVGTRIDGATVLTIETRMIRGHTWDLLPGGPTGTYWSDGVQLGSTLASN